MAIDGGDRRAGYGRPDASMALLNNLLRDSLDPGYAEAAARQGIERHPGERGRRLSPVLFAGIAALAALLVVSAVQTRHNAPQVATQRKDLIQRIDSGNAAADHTQQQIDQLHTQLDALQAQALREGGSAGEQAMNQLRALQASTGDAAVTGPGIKVVLTDAPGSQGNGSTDPRQNSTGSLGRIQDIDLQHLVNGLWAAGAEAVSVNGERLTVKSAIRTAGSAILVDFTPLAPPYQVLAIGDPRRLQARFVDGQDGRYLRVLKDNYGVGFDVSTQSSLSLPAATGFALSIAGVGQPGTPVPTPQEGSQ